MWYFCYLLYICPFQFCIEESEKWPPGRPVDWARPPFLSWPLSAPSPAEGLWWHFGSQGVSNKLDPEIYGPQEIWLWLPFWKRNNFFLHLIPLQPPDSTCWDTPFHLCPIWSTTQMLEITQFLPSAVSVGVLLLSSQYVIHLLRVWPWKQSLRQGPLWKWCTWDGLPGGGTLGKQDRAGMYSLETSL